MNSLAYAVKANFLLGWDHEWDQFVPDDLGLKE